MLHKCQPLNPTPPHLANASPLPPSLTNTYQSVINRTHKSLPPTVGASAAYPLRITECQTDQTYSSYRCLLLHTNLLFVLLHSATCSCFLCAYTSWPLISSGCTVIMLKIIRKREKYSFSVMFLFIHLIR